MFWCFFVFFFVFFFFFKQKTAYEIMPSLVGSEMCIRDRYRISRTKRKKSYQHLFSDHTAIKERIYFFEPFIFLYRIYIYPPIHIFRQQISGIGFVSALIIITIKVNSVAFHL